jgi:hypothetical protein
MALAVKILDTALRTDFGFKHLLWVFSGRRGIHCWVCDKRARTMTNTARTAVVDYLNVFKVLITDFSSLKGPSNISLQGGEKDKIKLAATSTPLHPSLRRAFEESICPIFETLIEEQGWLDSPDRWSKVLELIPDEDIRASLHARVSYPNIYIHIILFRALTLGLRQAVSVLLSLTRGGHEAGRACGSNIEHGLYVTFLVLEIRSRMWGIPRVFACGEFTCGLKNVLRILGDQWDVPLVI